MNPLTLSAFIALFSLTALGLSACQLPSAQSPVDESQTQAMLKKSFPVTLSKIADGVWVHTSNYRVPGQAPIPANGLIVEEADSVTLIDPAWGEMATFSLMKDIETQIGKPVKSVIVSHHHGDRVMGSDVVEAMGATIYTHPDTPKRAAKLGLPVPNTSVAELNAPKSRLKIGSVEVAYPGPGHALENLVVYIPSAQILYGGCAVKGAGSQTLGNIKDASLTEWPNSLNWVKATYPETRLIVPGHGKGAPNLTLIDNTLALIARQVNREAETKTESQKETP